MMKKKKQKKEKPSAPTKTDTEDKLKLQTDEGNKSSTTENNIEKNVAPNTTATSTSTSDKKLEPSLPQAPNVEGVSPQSVDTTTKTEDSKGLPTTLEANNQVTGQSSEKVKSDSSLSESQVSENTKTDGQCSDKVPKNGNVSSVTVKNEQEANKLETSQQTATDKNVNAVSQQLPTKTPEPENLGLNAIQGAKTNETPPTLLLGDLSKDTANQNQLRPESAKMDTISVIELKDNTEVPLDVTQKLETKKDDTIVKSQTKSNEKKQSNDNLLSTLPVAKVDDGGTKQNLQTPETLMVQGNANEKSLKKELSNDDSAVLKPITEENKKPEEIKLSDKSTFQDASDKNIKDAKLQQGKSKPAKVKKSNSVSPSNTSSLDSITTPPAVNPAKSDLKDAPETKTITSELAPLNEMTGKGSTKQEELVDNSDKNIKLQDTIINAAIIDDKENEERKQEKVSDVTNKAPSDSSSQVPEIVTGNKTPNTNKTSNVVNEENSIIGNKNSGSLANVVNDKNQKTDTTVTASSLAETGKKEACDKPTTQTSVNTNNETSSSSKSKKKKQDKTDPAKKVSESESSTKGGITKDKTSTAQSAPNKASTKNKPSGAVENNANLKEPNINGENATIKETTKPETTQTQIKKEAKPKAKPSEPSKSNNTEHTKQDAKSGTCAANQDVTNKENTTPNETLTSETSNEKAGKKKNKKQKSNQTSTDKVANQEGKSSDGSNNQKELLATSVQNQDILTDNKSIDSAKAQNDSSTSQKADGGKKSKRKGPKVTKPDTIEAVNSDSKSSLPPKLGLNNTDVLKESKMNTENTKTKMSSEVTNTKLNPQKIQNIESQQENDKDSNELLGNADSSDITLSQNEAGSELVSSESAKKRRRRKRKKQNRGETQSGKLDDNPAGKKNDSSPLKKKLDNNLNGTLTAQQEKANVADGNLKSSQIKPKMNQEEREEKLLKKKLAERAQQKLRNQIESNNLSDTEISEKYVETISKNLKELTKMRFLKLDVTDSQVNENDSDIDSDCDVYEYVANHRVTYLANFCHVCKDSLNHLGNNVKTCNECFLINYCSKDHQKSDWQKHKDMCQAIVQLCKQKAVNHLFQNAVGLSPENFRIYRLNLLVECSYILSRELEPHEREMILYPDICHTCYEYNKAKLESCVKCSCVSYCSKNHRHANHDTWCNDLQIYVSLVRYQSKNGIIRTNLPKMTTKIYDILNLDIKNLLQIMINDISLLKSVEYVTLTEIATAPLTALFAMYKTDREIENKETLVLHFVGAEWFFELDHPNKWEVFILHFLPNLKSLKLVFIGPEVAQMSNDAIACFKNSPVCNNCMDKKCTVDQYVSPIPLYHEYVYSDSYIKPDLICAFNAGLYRTTGYQGMDTWEDTIDSMLKDGIPVAVTSYTSEEIVQDVHRLQQSKDIDIVLQPSKNSYSSLKPSRSFINDEINPVIFKNFHIAVVKGKS